ncbi:hypothetical protein DFH08DRAFT_822974 [Mycena albidolilacea]|uniref:Uncharacterized protein n=1 Tax=Mycena albidolilacea TaxID=1033008 RepID=A0AAD6Z778_9AGAR|nr:hypothetical protein DFH08DRAFT_822974 [Mycena albidolilacea]
MASRNQPIQGTPRFCVEAHTTTLKIQLDRLPANPSISYEVPPWLRSFGIFSFSYFGYIPRLLNDSEALDEIKTFADACPTLQACRFAPSLMDQRAWRRVDGVWEKFPPHDFFVLAGISWD